LHCMNGAFLTKHIFSNIKYFRFICIMIEYSAVYIINKKCVSGCFNEKKKHGLKISWHCSFNYNNFVNVQFSHVQWIAVQYLKGTSHAMSTSGISPLTNPSRAYWS
jgi:hypothetical protein